MPKWKEDFKSTIHVLSIKIQKKRSKMNAKQQKEGNSNDQNGNELNRKEKSSDKNQ